MTQDISSENLTSSGRAPGRSQAGPSPLGGPADVPVGRGAVITLDGRHFEGVVLERGKTAGDADTLTFEQGRFRSSACDRYGYGDGPYIATLAGDGVAFEAETESAQYGKLRWHGVVRGARLDGTLTVLRNGQAASEKWVLAGEPA